MASPNAPSTLAGRLKAWFDVSASYHPSVLHDGETVTFLADPGELPQAYRVPMGGGKAIPISPDGQRVGTIHASPTAARAVVAVDAGGNEHWQLGLLEGIDASRPTLRALTASPNVIHSPGVWSDDGTRYLYTSNARDPKFFDVYEMMVDSSSPPRRLLQGDALHDVVSVHGSRVLVARQNTNLDVDLLLLDGESTTHLNPHVGEETIYQAALTEGAVYAGGNPGRERAALLRYRPGRPGHEFLRDYPGDVEVVEPSPDGKRILVGVNRDGWTELHLFDPVTAEDRPLPTSPRGVVANVSWFPDGTAFAHDLSSVEGVEVYRRSVETGKPRRLTSSPHPVPSVIAEPKLGTAVAVDRVAVPYWEYEPTARAKGTIIEVHGGPESQARPSLNRFRQFLVTEGWRVVAPNVRGSLGYGRSFVHLDDVRKRMDSVRDLRDLVGHLVARGHAEKGRVAVMGGSYGGFMVLSALSTYPELFGAGVDIVGIANFVTFLEETGPWRRAVREAEYGRLDVDREFLTSISPIHHAEKITAPLLVIHGRNDPRVPAREAEQMVATMKSLGRTVELLMFEDEGHGIVGRGNRERAYGRVAEFLTEQLGSAPPA
ncbi:MAG: alpha/beta fold hydrolase [Thermoplasmata archaeon]|nr:alpha/beta fold hydrolase [Thermoplasmata archaeon]